MKNTIIVLIILLSMIASSCATLEKERAKAKFEGITGVLLPVDTKGNEIVSQDKEKILLKLIPIVGGERLLNRVITFNPRNDGSFTHELGDGNYEVEVFLEGFYVKNLKVTVHKNELLDLGTIKIQKIEADMGVPLKEERKEEVIVNEGDVHIEPPSM